jgi:hypothetical protein
VRALRRIAAIAGAGTTLVLCLTFVLAEPADAAITHTYSSSFATESGPGTVAIDEENGYVYVLRSGFEVKRFDLNGNPAPFPTLPGNSIDGCCSYDGEADDNGKNGLLSANQIAVDNSGGPNQGILYVVHQNGFEVYSPTGEWIDDIEATSDPGLDNGFKWWSCGVAVDDAGNVYTSHQEFLGEDLPQEGFAYVDKFSPGKWEVGANPPQTPSVRSSLYGIPEGSCRMAVDSELSVFIIGGGVLRKYTAALFNLTQTTGKVIGTPFGYRNVSIDPTTDDIYATRSNQIQRIGPDGVLQEAIGIGNFTLSNGAAVNGSTGVVYAANNGAGGQVHRFLPAHTPDVEDVEVAPVQGSATISAQVDPDGAGPITTCQLAYGPTEAYGSTVPCSPDPNAAPPGSNFSTPTTVTAELSGLDLETTYHYRFEVGNAAGTTKDLNRSFTTHAVADVAAGEPTDVTQFTATLNGSFNGNGEPSSYYFEWGPTEAYGNTTATSPGEGVGSPTGPTDVSASIEGLSLYTLYHFRLVVTNTAGTTVSPDRIFYSSPPFLPTVGDAASSQLTPTTAMLSTTVKPGLGDTVVHFQYGTDTNYGKHTPIGASIGSDDAEHPVSSPVSGLEPGTTYHYRAIATNFAGSTQGSDETFTTPDVPAILSTSAAGVSDHAATLNAVITPNLSPTTYRFEYGESTGYGASTPESAPIGSDMQPHPVSTGLTSLNAGTTYHFRVVASNLFGTTQGPDHSFTTPPSQVAVPVPSGQKRKPRRCRRGQVRRGGKCRKRAKRKKSTGRRARDRRG